ncbi:hypothetical protein ERO13_A10G093300v2 [Gossypium hirsutum]|uniref:Uncharacterized protein isoform X1 n=1 Tax=Gossypium hirsutum TaxID=3635 RepID=A0ABM2YY39_GOSHI|nr:uncharacterized protein LOC121208298 isoform X1 [Gossypium hirsutum]KAG4179225.1 hypothetical protein ERO13_A10G093300v2 [Gossypium hirsutum]
MFPFPKWFKKATKLRIKGLSVLLLLFSGKCFLNFSVFDSVKHREKKLVSQRKNLRFFPEISVSHFTLQEKTSLQTFYTCNNFSPPPLLCSSYLRKTLLPVSLIGALTNHTKGIAFPFYSFYLIDGVVFFNNLCEAHSMEDVFEKAMVII